jgi:BirA family biotin operon repressor/biotin-[acetyl-CoA-carboxylase] ligase
MLDRNQLIITILGELGSRIDAWRSTKGPDDRLVADYERLSMTLGRNVVASLPVTAKSWGWRGSSTSWVA